MLPGHQTSHATRARLLRADLRQLYRQSDLVGRADQIHQLRNCILTAQGALGLVDAGLRQDEGAEIVMLLDLAATRLREGRALVARSRARSAVSP